MITAIDTNILLDILIPDEKYAESSKSLLDSYIEKGRLIISEIVYAELASQFASSTEMNRFLSATGIRLLGSSEKALYMAGERWTRYARKKGREVHCPRCNKQIAIVCPYCSAAVNIRQKVLSDFIIGAHALVHADLLLSRDRGVYKTYFGDLKVMGKL